MVIYQNGCDIIGCLLLSFGISCFNVIFCTSVAMQKGMIMYNVLLVFYNKRAYVTECWLCNQALKLLKRSGQNT